MSEDVPRTSICYICLRHGVRTAVVRERAYVLIRFNGVELISGTAPVQ